MQIAYASSGTKNVERLVSLLPYDNMDIEQASIHELQRLVSSPFVIAVPSYENSPQYDDFATLLDMDVLGNCKGIIGSGNKNFGDLYLVTAKELSKEFSIPIIYEMEFFGTKHDRQELENVIEYLQYKTE